MKYIKGEDWSESKEDGNKAKNSYVVQIIIIFVRSVINSNESSSKVRNYLRGVRKDQQAKKENEAFSLLSKLIFKESFQRLDEFEACYNEQNNDYRFDYNVQNLVNFVYRLNRLDFFNIFVLFDLLS